jgi:cytochrome c peroxidase
MPDTNRRALPFIAIQPSRLVKLAFCSLVALMAGFCLYDRTPLPVFASPETNVVAAPPISAIAAVGKKIFFDPSLSASGRISCSTCHSPAHAYGPPNGLAVQLGGPGTDRQGARAVPSLRYVLNRTPVWNKAFIASTAEHIVEGEEPPTGGFGWDGRFNTLHDQAAFPLLAPNKMANAGPEDIVAKLQRAGYAEDFCTVFGAQIFDDPQKAYAAMLVALERFELEDPSFHPYNSKYDDHLDGKVQLSPKEQRGLALFDDPRRGNCSSCHLDRKGIDGSHPLFTDYRSRRWVCRATRKFTPMPRPPTSIGAFAGLCVPISPQSRSTVVCSKHRRCAMWRHGRCFFTTGDFIR